MINFLIHTPINTRGFLIDYIKSNLGNLEKEIGDIISVHTPSHDHSKSWLLESISDDRLPDIMLSHSSDFAVLENSKLKELFSETAGEYADVNPVMNEYRVFEDPDRLFYPLFIVPLVMFYNKKYVIKEELTHSWKDLLNDKWNVVFPDKHTPISKVVMAYLKRNYRDKYDTLKQKIVFGKSPVEVIHAVAAGRYHIGISNLSFSLMAKQKGLEINPTVEGAILLPQVLVFKKNSNPKLTKIADLLIKKEFQRYLGEQGFWPVYDTAQIDILPDGEWKKDWKGWKRFLEELQELEAHSQNHSDHQ